MLIVYELHIYFTSPLYHLPDISTDFFIYIMLHVCFILSKGWNVKNPAYSNEYFTMF